MFVIVIPTISIDDDAVFVGSNPEDFRETNPVHARKFAGLADAECFLATLPAWARDLMRPYIVPFEPETDVASKVDRPTLDFIAEIQKGNK